MARCPVKKKLRKRRLHSVSSLPKLYQLSPTRPRTRMQWSTNEAMVATMEAVKKGSSIKRVALEHGVPRTTPQDGHLGKVVHGIKPVCQPYLYQAEEKMILCKW